MNEDELKLAEGEIITIINKDLPDKGWWKGELRGRIGVFPDNFVELLTQDGKLVVQFWDIKLILIMILQHVRHIKMVLSQIDHLMQLKVVNKTMYLAQKTHSTKHIRVLRCLEM